ncbi:acetyl-CoA C-acetyltransferase [Longispora sp. K20-0274]
MMTEAFIYDALRTPRGRGKKTGSLHEVKPVTLAVGLLRAALDRNPGLDPARIDDVIMGIVSPLGDQGSVLPKIAALAAGLPVTVGGTQLNRFCASGLEAVNIAAQKVRSGWDELILAGGVESMSRQPIGSDGGAWFHDPETSHQVGFVPQGVGADLIATIEGFSRTDVDTFALESQRKAALARSEGRFDRSLVQVLDRNGLTILDHDEFIKPQSTLEGLGNLPASFEVMGQAGGFDAVALQKYPHVERINHVHGPGNSSGIVDGAALVLVGSARAGQELGLTPRARVVSVAVSGADPVIMLTGPIPAIEKALAKADMTIDQIDLVEINEAFAAVPMKVVRDLKIDPDKVNVNGGAIALGHPLGATGAMLVGTVLDELERRGQRFGLITLCVGGGMGVATIIERI